MAKTQSMRKLLTHFCKEVILDQHGDVVQAVRESLEEHSLMRDFHADVYRSFLGDVKLLVREIAFTMLVLVNEKPYTQEQFLRLIQQIPELLQITVWRTHCQNRSLLAPGVFEKQEVYTIVARRTAVVIMECLLA